MNQDHKKKISIALLGRKQSLDHREKNRIGHIGQIAWNKGKKMGPNPEHSARMRGRKMSDEVKKKISEALKGVPRPSQKIILGKKRHNWTGDNVKYDALHKWIYHKMGRANECVNCGSKKNVQWANKDGMYRRKVSDFFQLCLLCHRHHDKSLGWGSIKRRWPIEK